MVEASHNVLGFAVTGLSVAECGERLAAWALTSEVCRTAVCLNAHAIAVAEEDGDFATALRSADLLVPDGAGVVLSSRLLGTGLRRRVTGWDLFHSTSVNLSATGAGKYFFLGATEGTLRTIRTNMSRDYPNITVVGCHSPPFQVQFSAGEVASMVERINDSGANVLWVGVSAPKQEKLLHLMKPSLRTGTAGAIGAVFDFFAGSVQRPPRLLQVAGLEWAGRLFREPRRLGRRILVSNARLGLLTARAALRRDVPT